MSKMRDGLIERPPGSGQWSLVVDQRDPITGKRRRRWHSFKGNRREAIKERAKLIAAQAKNEYIAPEKVTLKVYLEAWLDSRRANVSPRTFERYEEILKKNII